MHVHSDSATKWVAKVPRLEPSRGHHLRARRARQFFSGAYAGESRRIVVKELLHFKDSKPNSDNRCSQPRAGANENRTIGQVNLNKRDHPPAVPSEMSCSAFCNRGIIGGQCFRREGAAVRGQYLGQDSYRLAIQKPSGFPPCGTHRSVTPARKASDCRVCSHSSRWHRI